MFLSAADCVPLQTKRQLVEKALMLRRCEEEQVQLSQEMRQFLISVKQTVKDLRNKLERPHFELPSQPQDSAVDNEAVVDNTEHTDLECSGWFITLFVTSVSNS